MPDSATVIMASGAPGPKITLAVVGDGYSAADQATYNDTVDALLTRGVFGHDCFAEDAAGFRVVRINLISAESGVSQRRYDEHGTPLDKSDDTITSETPKNTALGYIYSGSWAHCWMEEGANTATLLDAALDRWVPDYDLVVVILHESGWGGCGGGGFHVVTSGYGWDVLAHEFGHGAAGLADEYCMAGTWTGGEPSSVNITTNTDRATLKWRRFVNPATPVPTGVNPAPGSGGCPDWNQGPRPAGWSSSDDAGLFEGASHSDSGVYRPVEDCRMRGNTPPYCPVCYTEIKQRYDAVSGREFRSIVVADIDGDGRDDLIVHTAGSLAIYRSLGTGAEFASHAVGSVGGWPISASDRFVVADIDGDGQDELVVRNPGAGGTPRLGVMRPVKTGGLQLDIRYDGDIPGWRMRPHDQWLAADVDGDGRAELVVFNGRDWSLPYLGVYRSVPGGLAAIVRYDGAMPGWTMRGHDRLALGDVTGDGRADLVVFNGQDWAIPYLGVLGSSGNGFSRLARYAGSLPGWTMRRGDQYLVGDFDGDGRADVYVFNGTDWAIAYLGLLRSTGAGLQPVRRYDGVLPGWHLRRHDRFQLAQPGSGAGTGLIVWNTSDWATGYLGAVTAAGTALTCNRVTSRVGEWNLGSQDALEIADLAGSGHQGSFVIHNHDWIGLGHLGPVPGLDHIYYRWIHDYRYGRNW